MFERNCKIFFTMFMINIKNVFSQDGASLFNTYGIAIRAGQHCAKILDEYKMNGSSGATAKIAGILSTAKTKSVTSITIKATKSGVAILIPF